MKIKVTLIKSDGEYSPLRNPITDCLVARALKRALKRDKIKYSSISVGFYCASIDGKKTHIPPLVRELINKWTVFDQKKEDFNPPRISFTLEFN